jgi:hypothetical protein
MAVATAAKTRSTNSSRPLLNPEGSRDQRTSATSMKVVAPVRTAPVVLMVATVKSCGAGRPSVAKLGRAVVRRRPCSPKS